MVYVAVDLHRKRSHVVATDERGTLMLSRRVANDREVMRELLAELGPGLDVALEATYGWDWLADLIEEEGHRLHLAHPLRTRAIASARVKTDALDARTLADLLRADLLPEAYVAPRELRELRELLRQRVFLTRLRTAAKNRIHALLARHGVIPTMSDLFGLAGRRFLEELSLTPPARQRVGELLRVIDALSAEIDALAQEITARAGDQAGCDVLNQIYGIGPYTALLIIAEVGAIERFPSARHLCAWAGLTPTIRSSDGKARLGHISRQGSPHLRWALVEAAQKAVQGGGPLREMFERISRRRGRKAAKVAVARRILELCYYGLRDGEIRCLRTQGRAGARSVMAGSR
jgi:transposase